MQRILAGILVGALGGIGADLLEQQRHLRILVIVLALLVGLAAGIVAGWRTPPLRAGFRNGLGVGVLAAALLGAGALRAGVSLSFAAHTLAARLTLIALLVGAAVCVALSVAVGGLTSGWTGYHRPASQPEPTPEATPAGPLPTPA